MTHMAEPQIQRVEPRAMENYFHSLKSNQETPNILLTVSLLETSDYSVLCFFSFIEYLLSLSLLSFSH